VTSSETAVGDGDCRFDAGDRADGARDDLAAKVSSVPLPASGTRRLGGDSGVGGDYLLADLGDGSWPVASIRVP
jgi:hypothetical protein